MLVFSSWQDAQKSLVCGTLAIGNFDGVHLGHQALIKKTIELKNDFLAGVMTFSPHPNALLGKGYEGCLSSDQEKLLFFSKLGVDIVIMQSSTLEFFSYTPENFVKEILADHLKIKHVVVGHDFSFGKGASGNTDSLRELAAKYGIMVFVLPPVLVNNERCSSSKIRGFLAFGKLLEAKAMLGRYYSIRGIVAKGNQLGKMMGFPTANIKPPFPLALRHGVYATVTRVFDGPSYQDFYSATNVGTRPSVTDSIEVLVESYCLDVHLDLYDKDIQVFFLAHIRDEEKFSSIKALKAQVQNDCQVIGHMFQENPQLFRDQA